MERVRATLNFRKFVKIYNVKTELEFDAIECIKQSGMAQLRNTVELAETKAIDSVDYLRYHAHHFV